MLKVLRQLIQLLWLSNSMQQPSWFDYRPPVIFKLQEVYLWPNVLLSRGNFVSTIYYLLSTSHSTFNIQRQVFFQVIDYFASKVAKVLIC